MLIGYARVSTSEQDTAMQLAALRKAGVRKVFEESRSAVKHRPQLVALLDTLRDGDVLVVYKLDCLARSMRDLLAIVDRIDQAGARFRSITEAIDTTTPAGEMVLHMLGAMAQFERSLIRERSIAGMEVAKANGVRLGRAPALDDRLTRPDRGASAQRHANGQQRRDGSPTGSTRQAPWPARRVPPRSCRRRGGTGPLAGPTLSAKKNARISGRFAWLQGGSTSLCTRAP